MTELTTVRTLSIAMLLAAAIAPRPIIGQDSLIAPRAKGSKAAPVTVYEMADFQCPYCRTFELQTFPILEKEYIATGKVRWIFINMPLPSIHANAEQAAEFAACAMKQGRFWPTHDRLYATQDQWETLKDPRQFFSAQMAGLGLNPGAMLTCLRNGVGRAIVADDASGAERAGASSTPSFYIEGGMMSGAQPVEIFRHILDSIYATKVRKPKA